jgi:hypothetical protein
MGEMAMKKNTGIRILEILLILEILIQTISCMQLEYIEAEASADGSGESSSSSKSLELQMSKHRLEYTGISYYEAILLCNEMSLKEGLDTLYQYDKPVHADDSLFWLPNLKVLENTPGYRLPTREEWSAARESGAMEDVDENIGEWLYKEANSEYSAFELAPNFLKAVGLYRGREGYPVYGLRLAKMQ